MTVQPRAGETARWLRRVGVAAAITLGVTLIAAGPAYAAPNDVRIVASGNVDLTVGGGARRVAFTVSNAGPMEADNVTVRVDVPLGGQGVAITSGPDGCEVGRTSLRCGINRLKRGDSESFSIQISPPQSGGPAPGQSTSEQGVARVEVGDDVNNANNSTGFRVTLRGPEETQTVQSVSGTVRDGDSSEPLTGARVVVTDSDDTTHRTTTDDSGQFSVTSSEDKPIVVGALQIAVAKKGYETKKIRRTGEAGAAITVRMTLIPVVDTTASESAEPTASEEAAIPPTGSADETGSGGFLIWMLYLLAALLVLGGIGAIVWLFVRRNEDDETGRYGQGAPGPGMPRGPGGPGGPGAPGAPPIGARGVYHGDPYGAPTSVMDGGPPTRMLGADSPTSVIGPGGLPGAIDQPTSVIGPGGLPPGRMDQPTSMIPRHGADQPTSRMGHPGLDEPTQVHSGPSADDDIYPHGRERYADGTGQHGYGDPGYGRDRGYGDPGYHDPGYHDQGYRDQGYGGPGYSNPEQTYGSQYGGQDPGYEQGTGPGRDQGYGGGRHSADDYETDRGHGEQPPPRRGRRSAEDRRLDWYED